MGRPPAHVAVVAWKGGETNAPLAEAWRLVGIPAEILTPPDALRLLEPDDVAVVRLDVLPTLDGIEDGLDEVAALERLGVRVVNRPPALVAAHDKLETARLLRAAGIPHPPTEHVSTIDELHGRELPFVVKPRLGSWGRDVHLCKTPLDRERCIAAIRDRSWFRDHGALVQEVVPPLRHDLRLVVAGGRVVGSAERCAAPGEWRTNVSLGGSSAPANAPGEACALGLAAVDAIGADFVGVDLLPLANGEHVVLELNGAPDFDRGYSLPGRDVFLDVADSLGLTVGRRLETSSS